MKIIKYLLFYWLLIIGLSSCKTSISISGTYLSLFKHKSRGLNMYMAHKFVINTDSTFNYSYIVIGTDEKFSSGIWKRIDKKTIVLNSDIQSNIIPLDIEVASSDNKNPVIDVKLIVPDKDEKEYRCSPYSAVIEDKWYMADFLPDRGSYGYEVTNYYSNNHELFFKVSKEPREFIFGRGKREYYLLETERKKMILNDGDIVHVTVTVPDSLFSYRVFSDEKIKFSGNKLIFKDKEDKNKANKLHIE